MISMDRLGSKLSEAGLFEDSSKNLAAARAKNDQALKYSSSPIDGPRKTNEPLNPSTYGFARPTKRRLNTSE